MNTITFRKDYNDGFGVHDMEKLMGEPVNVGDCPVCRKSRYLYKGMEVYFTTSEFEPKDILGDEDVYELILQPNGDLTLDWEGKNIVGLGREIKFVLDIEEGGGSCGNYSPPISSGCWSSGCG